MHVRKFSVESETINVDVLKIEKPSQIIEVRSIFVVSLQLTLSLNSPTLFLPQLGARDFTYEQFF